MFASLPTDFRWVYAKSQLGGAVTLGERLAVPVVDYSGGYTDPGSRLGSNPDAEVAATKELLDVAWAKGLPVVFTRMAYDGSGSGRGGGLWPRKLPALSDPLLGSEAVEIDPRLDVRHPRQVRGRRGDRRCAELSARGARRAFEAGQLLVVVPPLLRLEIVNVAGRRWGWAEPALIELATALDSLGFEFKEPELSSVSRWTARGLTAYDATYVALAELEAIELITDDNLVLSVASEIAVALSATDV